MNEGAADTARPTACSRTAWKETCELDGGSLWGEGFYVFILDSLLLSLERITFTVKRIQAESDGGRITSCRRLQKLANGKFPFGSPSNCSDRGVVLPFEGHCACCALQGEDRGGRGTHGGSKLAPVAPQVLCQADREGSTVLPSRSRCGWSLWVCQPLTPSPALLRPWLLQALQQFLLGTKAPYESDKEEVTAVAVRVGERKAICVLSFGNGMLLGLRRRLGRTEAAPWCCLGGPWRPRSG